MGYPFTSNLMNKLLVEAERTDIPPSDVEIARMKNRLEYTRTVYKDQLVGKIAEKMRLFKL